MSPAFHSKGSSTSGWDGGWAEAALVALVALVMLVVVWVVVVVVVVVVVAEDVALLVLLLVAAAVVAVAAKVSAATVTRISIFIFVMKELRSAVSNFPPYVSSKARCRLVQLCCRTGTGFVDIKRRCSDVRFRLSRDVGRHRGCTMLMRRMG
jgi:hypothetical protein